MKSFHFSIALILLMFSMIGCQKQEESVAQIVAANETLQIKDTTTPAPTILATLTPSPTPTSTFTLTPTATFTATSTQTFTPTPTPFIGFEQSSINYGSYQNGQAIISFSVPEVSRDYYASVDSTYPMICSPSTKYPDILVCVGAYFRLYSTVLTVSFYEEPSFATLAYSGTYYLGSTSDLVEPTKSPWIISWAPDDGSCERRQNVSCETEYRTYDGVPCMDSTCTDTCGYLYSVDNCPPSGDWIAISRPPGPGWEPLDVVKP